MHSKLFALAGAAVLGSSAMLASQASAAPVYAITDHDTLVTFDNLTPQNVLTANGLTGLLPNDHLVGIDFRPATGTLYATSLQHRLYTVNPATGVATPVGAGYGPISGNAFGVDFNPTNDQLRVVSDTDVSYRVSPTTGLLDPGVPNPNPSLNYANGTNPNVVGVAYTNSTNPAPATTTLYGIDSNTDTLVSIVPGTGVLTTIGGLGVNTNNFVGFDISANNVAFAALQPTNSSVSNLYAINLTTGLATLQGQIVGGERIVDITLEPGVNFVVPEPGSILSLGAAALALGLRRRTNA